MRRVNREERRLELIEVLKELVNSDNSWCGEMQMVTHSGKSVLVMSRWSVLRDSKGNAKALLAVHQDLSEKKELEQQFFQAQRMQGLGSLAAGVAHELNNSLAPVLMSVDLLRDTLMGKVERNLLTTMERFLVVPIRWKLMSLLKMVRLFSVGLNLL